MASRFTNPYADVGPGISPEDGAKYFFFESGTSTPKDTYPTETDAINGTNANTNPVIANANGVFPEIWIVGRYKVQLFDKNDVQQNPGEWDPVIDISANEKQISDFPAVATITGNNIIHTKDTANNDVTMTVDQVVAEGTPATKNSLVSLDAADGVAVVDDSAGDEVKKMTQDNFRASLPPRPSGTLTTLESSDTVVVADASDSSNMKDISQDNFKAALSLSVGNVPNERNAILQLYTTGQAWFDSDVIDATAANKFVSLKFDPEQGEDNTTYYAHGAEDTRSEPTIPVGAPDYTDSSAENLQRLAYVVGHATSNSIANGYTMKLRLDGDGKCRIVSSRSNTRVAITLEEVFD